MPSTLRSKPAVIALFNLGLCSAVVYAALLLRFPLLSLYTNMRFVLKDYTQSNGTTGAILLLGLVVVWACYAFGAVILRRLDHIGRGAALAVLFIPILCGGIVFMVQTITSTDLYDYLFRGRMIVHYGANTFVTPPNVYPDDPLFPYVVWRNAVSAYGPLWEGMSWLASWFAGERYGGAPQPNPPALFNLLMAYKLIQVIGWLLCGWAIWGALGRIAPQQRWLGLYLWLWNPLVLWETLAAGHNDILMVLPIVLAVWAFYEAKERKSEGAQSAEQTQNNGQRTTDNGQRTISRFPGLRVFLSPLFLLVLALVALVVGGLIKYLALVLGPLVLLAGLRILPTWRQRAWLTFGGGAICVALIVLSYMPFWVGPDTLMNFDHRKHLANSSWLAALRPILAEQSTLDEAKVQVTTAGTVLLLLGVAWATWRSWRAPDRLLEHMTWLLLWFLFACSPWYQPWYAIWPLALVVLQPRRQHLVWATVLFCFLGMVGYYATTFAMPQLGLKETESTWHALLTVLIFVPPLLVPAVSELRRFVAAPTTTTRGPLRLWLYGALMSLITLAFVARYPLAGNAGQLTDIGKLSNYGWPEFLGYVLGMGAMFGLYVLAVRESRVVGMRVALPVVWCFGIFMALALVLMYPVNAIDTFLYAARSRLVSEYGVNPISVPLATFPNDPWLPFATDYWAVRLSPYGPLWNLIAAPITALSGTNMAMAVVGFKLLAVAALLGGGWVLMRLMNERAATGALLYLWNPLVLWEGIANGHNDVLLVLFMLLALLAWQQRRNTLVIPLLVAATLLKYVALPLLPIAAVALWQRANTPEQRWRVGWQSALSSVVVVLVSMFPFYQFTSLFASLQQQNDLAYTSPASLAAALLKPSYPSEIVTDWVSSVGIVLLALMMVWQMLQVWRDPERIGRAWFEVLFVLMLVAVASSRAWYVIWLVALAAPLYPGWPWRRTLAWSVSALAGYAFFIWIEAWLQPGYDRAQIIGTLLILGPPVFVTCLELADRLFRPRERAETPVVAGRVKASARR